MNILFTRGNSILSRAIRSATGEDCSHVLIEFEPGLVIHSNLLGIHINTLEHLRNGGLEVVHTVEVPPVEGMTEVLTKYEGKSYDLLALLWLGIQALIPFRKNNQWANKSKFTCTEFVTEVLFGEQDSVITPFQLYVKLIKEFH